MASDQNHPLWDSRNPKRLILSTILLGFITNGVFDIVKAKDQSSPLTPVLLAAACFLFLMVLHSRAVRGWFFRLHEPPPRPTVERVKVRAQALITILSVGAGRSSTVEAALWHQPLLREMYMITSSSGKNDSEIVRQELAKRSPELKVHETVFVDDIYNIVEMQDEVEHIRDRLKKQYSDADIICDFTGGTKSASAGMIFACSRRTARLQYMHPNQVDADGRAVIAAGNYPMEVNVAYQLDDDF